MTREKTNRPETVGRYFRTIDAALDALDIYFDDAESPLRNHALTGAIVSGYVRRLRHSFEAWENRLGFADRFRINRGESGYPLYQHVLDLERDAKNAERKLAEIPDGDTLREEMVDFILRKKKFPSATQTAMAERLYLEEVLKGEIFSPLVLPESVKVSVNPKSERPFYVVHWGAFDGTANLPLIYTAVIEDSSPSMAASLTDGEGDLKADLDIPLPIGGLLNPDLAHAFDSFVEKNASYGLTLATIADNMDRDFEELHPKQLRRIVMGPFYSAGLTSHGRVVETILEGVKNDAHAWMLTWTEQELFAISETPGKRGLFSSTPARQTYHIETNDLEATRQGVSAYERHALIPHEAYQAIYASGKRDEIFAGYKTHVVSGDQVLRDF